MAFEKLRPHPTSSSFPLPQLFVVVEMSAADCHDSTLMAGGRYDKIICFAWSWCLSTATVK